jgi:hypothetical protein
MRKDHYFKPTANIARQNIVPTYTGKENDSPINVPEYTSLPICSFKVRTLFLKVYLEILIFCNRGINRYHDLAADVRYAFVSLWKLIIFKRH